MGTSNLSISTDHETLPEEYIDQYRDNGFVKIPGILTPGEVEYYRDAVMTLQREWEASPSEERSGGDLFSQMVNVWRSDEILKKLTFHPNLAGVAAKLSGLSLRLWHDHILIKRPHNKVPTEFHQDQPNWPHADRGKLNSLTAWIALVDIPLERGCMTFIPKSHNRKDIEPQDLTDPRSLFELAPEMEWEPRMSLPLKAGDCTFHHGMCAHMANANTTDEYRIAHIIVYIGENTKYSGKEHVVTDPLNLEIGDPLNGELFPVLTQV